MARSLQIPQYSTGTVGIAEVSSVWTLTGSGTNFLSPEGVTNWTVAVGDMVICAGAFGIVGSVVSATVLTLSYWSGTTVSAGAAYVINRLAPIPSQALAGYLQQIIALYASIQTRTAVADANYSALTTDRNIAYSAISAARTVSLPSAASFPTGTDLTLFDESGSCSSTNTITGAANGTDLINGKSTAVIACAFGYVQLQSNGANKWTILGMDIGSTVAAYSTTSGAPGVMFNNGGVVEQS